MNDYSDIINLPHHVSCKHNHMSMSERAAQFSPFAALNGYEEAIRKVQKELPGIITREEGNAKEINEKLRMALENHLNIKISYFSRDADYKGRYISETGTICSINGEARTIRIGNSGPIPIDTISSVEEIP